MSLAQFEKAVEIIGNLPEDGPIKPTTDDRLYFYKYFKQGKIGNNETARPGILDFTGKAKWNAWTEVKDTPKEEAYQKYVEKLISILKSVDDDEAKKHIAAIESA